MEIKLPLNEFMIDMMKTKSSQSETIIKYTVTGDENVTKGFVYVNLKDGNLLVSFNPEDYKSEMALTFVQGLLSYLGIHNKLEKTSPFTQLGILGHY